MFWITRAPEKIKAVRKLITTPATELNWTKIANGSSSCATISAYKDVKQRWLMFFSKEAYHREVKTLDKKIKMEGANQNKAWWHLSQQMFMCQYDAYKQAETQKKLLKYHEVTYSVLEVKKYHAKGRPKVGECPKTVGYKIECSMCVNEHKVTEIRTCKG